MHLDQGLASFDDHVETWFSLIGVLEQLVIYWLNFFSESMHEKPSK